MNKKYTAVVRSPKDVYGIELVSFKIFDKAYWTPAMSKLIGMKLEFRLGEDGKFYYSNECLQFEPEWLTDIQEVVDWSKVPVDAKVEVRDHKDDLWIHRHFDEVKDGVFWCFESGCTSWTAIGSSTAWKYCRLPEVES